MRNVAPLAAALFNSYWYILLYRRHKRCDTLPPFTGDYNNRQKKKKKKKRSIASAAASSFPNGLVARRWTRFSPGTCRIQSNSASRPLFFFSRVFYCDTRASERRRRDRTSLRNKREKGEFFCFFLSFFFSGSAGENPLGSCKVIPVVHFLLRRQSAARISFCFGKQKKSKCSSQQQSVPTRRSPLFPLKRCRFASFLRAPCMPF